jgi:urate oxidase
MTAGIRLEGDFEGSYKEGDNRLVLPTDTMKNTVYALAGDAAFEDPEKFALLLGRHFVNQQPHVTRARIVVEEHPWQRAGARFFVAGGNYRRIARASVARDGEILEGGVAGYTLLRTSGSSFEGYLKDRYTTLPETRDRILATSLTAMWRHDGSVSFDRVMSVLKETFAAHDSKSVQHTLYAMGEAVLREFEHISRIRLKMPNLHYLPVNLAPLGLENRNEIFCPTTEPHGVIEAVIER